MIDNTDSEYIIASDMAYRSLFEKKEEEKVKETAVHRGPNIMFKDRLCFLEVMLLDEVKILYRASQDLLSRGSLDVRNSIMQLIDFYDKAATVFNNATFVRETLVLPDLHDDFQSPIKLPLKEYHITRDKAKDVMTTIRPRLASMVENYELSGAGSGQCREEKQDQYGHFGLDLCEDGDDRKNFVKNGNESYLLYCWRRLDEEDFFQFTICILNKFHRSNTTDYTLVSNKHSTSTTCVK